MSAPTCTQSYGLQLVSLTSNECDPNTHGRPAARLVRGFGAPMALEAGDIGTISGIGAGHRDHGRGVAVAVGGRRPVAIAAGSTIYRRRNTRAGLVRPGNPGLGGAAAMEGPPGA